MATKLRTKLSPRNPYYISKHRRLELQHFCLQYPIWRDALYSLTGLQSRPDDLQIFHDKHGVSDPTYACVLARKFYRDRMDMVEKAAQLADPELANYIMKGATEDKTYDNLLLMHSIPCSRKTYYDRLHKFYYELNKLRK